MPLTKKNIAAMTAAWETGAGCEGEEKAWKPLPEAIMKKLAERHSRCSQIVTPFTSELCKRVKLQVSQVRVVKL